MTAQIYDQAQLDALLSLGGTELRDQFLTDLERCQTRLSQSLSLAGTEERRGLDHARHALHELRGIALTVGAATLTRHCAEAEAFCDMGRLAEVVAKQADILAICTDLGAQIMAHSTELS